MPRDDCGDPEGFWIGFTLAEAEFDADPDRTDWFNPFPEGTGAHAGYEEAWYTFNCK